MLPGYLEPATVRRIETVAERVATRDIDIGYRAWKPKPWLGRHGMSKGWIAAAFFGFCSIGIVPRLFDREDQVRISAEGIRAKQWSDATIAWDAIADLFVWYHRGQQLLVLRLVDPAGYPSNRPFAGLAALNRRLTGGDVAISLAGTDRRVDEAMAAVARFRPASF